MPFSQTAFTVGMKRIQFSATYPAEFRHPLHGKIMNGTPIQRAELLMWTPTEDATTLLWCDGDREATEAVIDEIDSLVTSNLVQDIDGTYAFLQQSAYEFPTAVLETMADSAVIFLPPVVFLDTGSVEFEAVGEATALREFYDELTALAEVTIEQVNVFERKHASSPLTDRQRAALDAAISVGYYEIPRDGAIADIARVLDCSPSTAGELVRKAEAAAIRAYCDVD